MNDAEVAQWRASQAYISDPRGHVDGYFWVERNGKVIDPRDVSSNMAATRRQYDMEITGKVGHVGR